MLWIWENRISAEEERKCSHPLWALCMEEDQHIQLGGVLVSVQSHPRKSCYLLVTHVTCCCVPSPGWEWGLQSARRDGSVTGGPLFRCIRWPCAPGRHPLGAGGRGLFYDGQGTWDQQRLEQLLRVQGPPTPGSLHPLPTEDQLLVSRVPGRLVSTPMGRVTLPEG